MHVHTHKDAIHNLPLTESSPGRALPQQSVTPDPGHLRRHSKWRTLQPSALPSCRHCILAALSWLSSAGLACASVPGHCPRSLPVHCDSTRHVPSGAETHKSCQAMCFPVSLLVSLLAWQLLIQLSLQSKCHFPPHSCRDAL